jgi:hypothetical protein
VLRQQNEVSDICPNHPPTNEGSAKQPLSEKNNITETSLFLFCSKSLGVQAYFSQAGACRGQSLTQRKEMSVSSNLPGFSVFPKEESAPTNLVQLHLLGDSTPKEYTF